MNTVTATAARTDYELVEAAIDYFRDHQNAQPSLAEVARTLGVSDGHLHRLFRSMTGLTPKQFLQALTVEKAKRLLNNPEASPPVLDTALDVGLSGPGRLHDHFVTLEAMTPAEFRDQGADLTIRHGQIDTPFGRAFLALTERGVCQFGFVDGAQGKDGLSRLQTTFPQAELIADQAVAEQAASTLLDCVNGTSIQPLRLWVKGTNFQVQVWRALLGLSRGTLCDYASVARQIGKPSATRAVASAVGANPVALVIPCHRVIRRDGGLGGYHWGLARKQMLLAQEVRAD
ncbi:MAG: methylated-DNA--[protein]-cysteine S-methyltransferase [Pseudomonadota bacterium]